MTVVMLPNRPFLQRLPTPDAGEDLPHWADRTNVQHGCRTEYRRLATARFRGCRETLLDLSSCPASPIGQSKMVFLGYRQGNPAIS